MRLLEKALAADWKEDAEGSVSLFKGDPQKEGTYYQGQSSIMNHIQLLQGGYGDARLYIYEKLKGQADNLDESIQLPHMQPLNLLLSQLYSRSGAVSSPF